MLHCHDPGSKTTVCSGPYLRNLRSKIMEVLARVTYLFKAVPGLKLTILRTLSPSHFQRAKTYLRIRKLKSCDREHDLPSCNQDILWQLPCNGHFVGWNVFHLPGLRMLIGALSEGKKKCACQQSQVNIPNLPQSMIPHLLVFSTFCCLQKIEQFLHNFSFF